MPAAAQPASTSQGHVVSAAGKYDASRTSVAPAPGGNHCPIAPHGAGRNSSGAAADEIGLAMSRKSTGPRATPARPTTAAKPTMGAPTARSADANTEALSR